MAAKVGVELHKVINKHLVTKVWNERGCLATLDDTEVAGGAKRSRRSDVEQVESVLYAWVVTMCEKKATLNDHLLMTNAKAIAKELHNRG